MKFKKGILLTALTLLAISIIGTFSNVKATTATTPITLSIKKTRSSGYSYRVTNNGEKYIWKIYKTSNNLNETFYCIKGGSGFGSDIMGTSIDSATYTECFNMRYPENIGNSESTSAYRMALSNILGTENYEKLMWVLDQCYVQLKTNASDTDIIIANESKQALLDAVEEYAEKYPNVYTNTSLNYSRLTDYLTDEDIDAIQQLAIWHFTNNGDGAYDIGNTNPVIKIYANNDSSFAFPRENDNYDTSRVHAMDALYAYLTQTPQETGFSYDYKNNSSSSKPVEIIDTTITIETSGNRLIVGPYKIEEVRDINYSLNGTFTDGNDDEITDVEYLDSSKNPVADGTTLKDLVGNNFYISIPSTTNTSNIKLSINGNFFATEATYWSVKNPTEIDQPIVQIEKVNSSFSDYIDIQVEGSYQIQLEKVDINDTSVKLSGAEFSYTLPGTTEPATGITNENGILDLGTIEITDPSYPDIITVTETKAPTGYSKLIDSITIQITKETSGENYLLSNATITSGSVEGINVSISGNVIKITVPNQKRIFDLSLRKFITDVTDSNNSSQVIASREPNVNVSPLLNGETTAIYNHTKEPVGISNGDIVTYTIRVYNEGKIDGYVTEITDYLPSQLEFIVNDELNAKYGWQIVEGSNGRIVKTDITSPTTLYSASRDIIYADRDTGSDTDKVLLKAFAYTEEAELDYIDVQIRCRVKENINLYEKITNIAEITGFTDSEGNIIKDRDSQAGPTEGLAVIPSDATLPEYKDTEIKRGDKFIEGQQDDDDFEKLVLQRFDLALRKFITGVDNGETITNITNRAPVFTKVSDTEYTYEHTKEPVEVANGNTVIYTLRIFNEGNMPGYATEVKDNLPDGLEFLPENSINTAFGWKMYNKDGTETNDILEASYIKTDFLSKDKEAEEGDNLIAAFDSSTMTMPDYKDLKIAFKVTEPDTSDKIIINTAEIAKDSDENGNTIDDVDSIPNNNKDGEDDIDIEKIKVKYFDLSLKKWVTESIVTYNGKTTVTKSGHTGDENPEAPMKVEIQTANINKTIVKFRFNIKVINEGEIAGYATELIDYIPDGLKFVSEDNPDWEVSEDGKVTTDQLKDTLLQPGESATIDIVLTWINSKDNMGEKINWAEISKDKNDYNSPDIDSTPGNNVKGEDDIDQAPVLLSPATGSIQTYIGLTLACVTIIASGVFLIKKFVI